MVDVAKRGAVLKPVLIALILLFVSGCRRDSGSDRVRSVPRDPVSARAIDLALAPPLSERRRRATGDSTAAATHAVIVSVDGMAARYVQPLVVNGELPTMRRLGQQGAWTHNARTDVFNTATIPNHVCMVTGLPSEHTPGFPMQAHHGYTRNILPEPGETLHNTGNPSLRYVPSIFDVAHDFGLVTCLYASKPKFVLFAASYDHKSGAKDLIGPDNGNNKIDVTVIEEDTEHLVSQFVERQKSAPCNLALLHLGDPDTAGHRWGWGSAEYLQSLKRSDGLIGQVLAGVEREAAPQGRIALIVTSDHGGVDNNHNENERRENFAIPFYVWAPGVPAGKDLYDVMSQSRKDPGGENPPYGAKPRPIRNGDAGNLALVLLGLPPVPGSLMFVPDSDF